MIIWHGLKTYQQGELIQKEALSLTQGTKSGLILGFEFKPCITLGIRGRPEEDLLVSTEELEAKGFSLFKSPRGGQATLHQPGQLVIYPIFDLRALKIGPRCWTEHLLNYSQSFLREQYGVQTERLEGRPGLYTSGGKILYLGLRIQRGISSHGLALNVTNPLEDFALIRSCGQEIHSHDSLAHQGKKASPQEVFSLWAQGLNAHLTSSLCQV